MNQITITKEKVEKQKGVVILPLKEYRELERRAMPAYYLTSKAALKLDQLVRSGIREFKLGRTKAIQSLTDLD